MAESHYFKACLLLIAFGATQHLCQAYAIKVGSHLIYFYMLFIQMTPFYDFMFQG